MIPYQLFAANVGLEIFEFIFGINYLKNYEIEITKEKYQEKEKILKDKELHVKKRKRKKTQ